MLKSSEQLELFPIENSISEEEKKTPNLQVLSHKELKKASYFSRAFAFVVDIMIIKTLLSFMWTIAKPIFMTLAILQGNSNIWAPQTTFLLISEGLIIVWYFSTLNYLWGYTPGKRLMNISVKHDGFTQLPLKQAIIRHIPYFAFYVFLVLFFFGSTWLRAISSIAAYMILIDFIYPLIRKDKKALHDILAKTSVICN